MRESVTVSTSLHQYPCFEVEFCWKIADNYDAFDDFNRFSRHFVFQHIRISPGGLHTYDIRFAAFFCPQERQQRLARGRLSLARRKAAEAQEVSEAPGLCIFGELATIHTRFPDISP